MENSFLHLYIGMERSGKSYLAKKLGNIYQKNRGSVLVYNFGKQSDFPSPEYNYIEPLSFKEHAKIIHKKIGKAEAQNYNLDKKILFFRWNKKVYHFKDFNSLFYKKKVKMYRIANRPEETAFFKAYYLYVSRNLLVLDDCKVAFTYGLNDGHIQLFSRKNHTGGLTSTKALKNKGCDIICIFHNVDHVNKDLWDFTTSVVLLEFPNRPTYKKISNDSLIGVMDRCYHYLADAPKYTALEIPLTGSKANKVIKIPNQ